MSGLVPVIALCAVAGCGDSNLRGSFSKSEDGETYLAVVDDNNGSCVPSKIDDKVWPHPVARAARIEPGNHVISCGTDAGSKISFTVPEGTVFKFDYWGP